MSNQTENKTITIDLTARPFYAELFARMIVEHLFRMFDFHRAKSYDNIFCDIKIIGEMISNHGGIVTVWWLADVDSGWTEIVGSEVAAMGDGVTAKIDIDWLKKRITIEKLP